MPVYLYTYHAYGSWLPNRRQAFVQRDRGIEPNNRAMANRYRQARKQSEVIFDTNHQRRIIDALIDSQAKQSFRAFGVATDPTHAHVLVAWNDNRDAAALRGRIKTSLSYALNHEFGRREWLSEGGSRKRVRNRTHFDYLLEHYFPKHSGVVWTATAGFRTACRSG